MGSCPRLASDFGELLSEIVEHLVQDFVNAWLGRLPIGSIRFPCVPLGTFAPYPFCNNRAAFELVSHSGDIR